MNFVSFVPEWAEIFIAADLGFGVLFLLVRWVYKNQTVFKIPPGTAQNPGPSAVEADWANRFPYDI
jgi:hypothetical protein